MTLEERFGTVKPVIAMVHFPGLPGRPRHDRAAGRNRLIDVVGRDLEVLQEAGVDALLFCNENDIPYQLAVGPEIPAAIRSGPGLLPTSCPAALLPEAAGRVREPGQGEDNAHAQGQEVDWPAQRRASRQEDDNEEDSAEDEEPRPQIRLPSGHVPRPEGTLVVFHPPYLPYERPANLSRRAGCRNSA